MTNEADEAEERINVIVLGRHLGTASGWDQVDDHAVHFYDFDPREGVSLPKAAGITFQFESGFVETYDSDGAIDFQSDIISEFAAFPRNV